MNEVSIDNKKWYGNEVQVDSGTPLRDDGTGYIYVIRQFEFAINPETQRKIKDKKLPPPSKQDLFNSNWHQIRTTLWGDGLLAIEESEYPPRIVVGKKKYKIILVCKPRLGTMVAERPNTLQELTPSSFTKKK